MSYDSDEQSRDSGAPQEAYDFVMGTTHYRQTSGDVTLSVADAAAPHTVQTYTPTYLRRPDALDFSQEEWAGEVVLRVHRANPVAVLFRAYTPPAPVGLTVYRVIGANAVVAFVGKVTSVAWEAGEAALTCAPIAQVLKRGCPATVFQSPCNHPLYSPGCGVDKATFVVSGTVTAVSGATVSAAIFAYSAHAAGWFVNGWVEVASGERRFVVADADGSVQLMSAFPTASLTVGTTFTAYAGCARTEAVCVAKFNNLVHHLGWPRIPFRNPFVKGAT